VLPPESVPALASAWGFTDVALPMASCPCEALDCSRLQREQRREQKPWHHPASVHSCPPAISQKKPIMRHLAENVTPGTR
jgi:hypothetical protein